MSGMDREESGRIGIPRKSVAARKLRSPQTRFTTGFHRSCGDQAAYRYEPPVEPSNQSVTPGHVEAEERFARSACAEESQCGLACGGKAVN